MLCTGHAPGDGGDGMDQVGSCIASPVFPVKNSRPEQKGRWQPFCQRRRPREWCCGRFHWTIMSFLPHSFDAGRRAACVASEMAPLPAPMSSSRKPGRVDSGQSIRPGAPAPGPTLALRHVALHDPDLHARWPRLCAAARSGAPNVQPPPMNQANATRRTMSLRPRAPSAIACSGSSLIQHPADGAGKSGWLERICDFEAALVREQSPRKFEPVTAANRAPVRSTIDAKTRSSPVQRDGII